MGCAGQGEHKEKVVSTLTAAEKWEHLNTKTLKFPECKCYISQTEQNQNTDLLTKFWPALQGEDGDTFGHKTSRELHGDWCSWGPG